MTQHTPSRFRGFQGPNYTQVPDAVFDELLPDLTGAELKVLLYVIRRTFGFKRNSDHISLSQMLRGIRTKDGRELDRGVGLTKKTLLTAINSLEEKGIILTERRRSADRGDEPTTYRLNVVDAPRGVETTPPVGEKLHQGGGVETPPRPWSKNSPTQETGLQETVEQQTELEDLSQLSPNPEISLSKFRKGTTREFQEEKPGERIPTEPKERPSPTGFEPVSSVLTETPKPAGERVGQPPHVHKRRTERPETAPRSPQVPETIPSNAGPLRATSEPVHVQPSRRSAAAAQVSSSAGEERALIQAYIESYAAEFHDQARLKSSVTRAHNLFIRSGLAFDETAWVQAFYDARRITRERAAAIGWQGEDKPRRGMSAAGLNKMPYFFDVLECVLGLHDHSGGPEQHPMPLSRQEFFTQQRKKTNEPERTSLSGKYSHLVHR